MATGPGFPSSTNTYVPSFDASGRLVIGYSRNPNKFVINKYVQYVESPKTVGYYLKLSPQEAARIVSGQDYEWPDGQVRPMHADGLEQFNYVQFRTARKDYGFTIGEMAAEQADWAILEQHSQIKAAQAMTGRTVDVLSTLTTTTNWTVAGATDPDLSADHTATATSLAGGQFDLGTSTAPYIKKALDKIAVLINLDTLGVVEPQQLMVIMNPNQARLWAESSEIHEYIKGSPAALDEIRSGTSPNARYGPGLPSTIYGYQIHVENAVKVTSRKGATLAKSFAFPDQQVAVVSRIGDIEGVYGSPSFSTLTVFWYKDELTLERFDDPKNRLVEGHVVQNYVPVITSPLSGYLVTSSTSVAS